MVSSDVILTAIIISGVAAALLILLFCIIRRCRCEATQRPFPQRQGRSLQTTDNLIPPVFYTGDMKDPLLWPDLNEPKP
jgi:hypothetical protein